MSMKPGLKQTQHFAGALVVLAQVHRNQGGHLRNCVFITIEL